jgi:hypothetical protein
MKRISWKYMAGLVDGEGCIDLQWHRKKDYPDSVYARPRLRLTLVGDDGKKLLENCAANFGGTVGCKSANHPVWQDAHTWSLCQQTHLRAFLQNITNHLTLKQEQARFTIYWLDRGCGKGLGEDAKRFAVDVLKAMKRDPQRLSERAAMDIEAMAEATVQQTEAASTL